MKALLYCTKNAPYLVHESGDYDCNDMSCSYDCYSVVDKQYLIDEDAEALNGKIVAECDYEMEEIEYCKNGYHRATGRTCSYDLEKNSCLNIHQFKDYLGEKNGKAIHIKNLHIFDEPRPLYYYRAINRKRKTMDILYLAPQNMMHCFEYKGLEEKGEEIKYIFDEYILISIHPEHLCKILNGEKTIEVRKKVLKCM